MRILHVASEVAPFSKTGGLADVASALPRALAKLGLEVVVVSPRYRSVEMERFGLGRRLRTVNVSLGDSVVEVGIVEGRLPGSRVPALFVDHPPSFDREGLYGERGTGDYPDNARRFVLLGRAALAFAAELNLWPDIVHGHDWQAGPALLAVRRLAAQKRRPRTVFTIHNLAYQGIFPDSVVDELDLGRELYQLEGFEYWGQVSMLKAGVMLADRITTVSPRYAREIQSPELGMGFDGILRARADCLSGILNGVDYEVWNPERDPWIAAHYSASDLGGKRQCKADLQRRFHLPLRPRTPLCGSISRLTDQKGFDLIAAALPEIMERDLQYVILGTGERALEQELKRLEAAYPTKLAVRLAYDEKLAHQIEAGCDLYLMPSRFEPCGLNQMYSLRYGTPPIVRATGGLDDTVVEHDGRSRSGNGFKFAPYAKQALLHAWTRALLVYRIEDEFSALVRRCMLQDFSWNAAARAYAQLYARLVRG